MSINRFYIISPLALVAVSACRSPFTTNTASGSIVKGPLSNALVFLDLDGDNVLDPNEQSIRTDANGKFTINTNSVNYKIVALTDESTVDTSSGAILAGVTLSAPKGAAVVTPTTTLMEEGGLTASEVAEVLGLPDGVDPLTFNPFEAGVDAATALAVEKVSQQIMTAVSSFASAAEGAGASEKGAFTAALNSVVDVIKVKAEKIKDPNAAAADKKIDFTKAADLDLIKAKVADEAEKIVTAEGRTADFSKTALTSLVNDTATSIKNVNDQIGGVTDLTSEASKNVFSNLQVLQDQVKTAAKAEKATPGSGSIDFKDATKVTASAKNKPPQDIKFTGDGIISENASSLVLGTVSTVDSDQTTGTAFKYKLAGKDADFFSLSERTGELSLDRKPDYEAKASYEVAIITEDSGGKKYAETFKISVVKAKAGEVYESSNAGNTTFLIVDGATSGNFNVIPVKIKSDRSGYEFDASKKTEAAFDVSADKLSESIGRDPAMKAVASNSDATTAATAAQTALTPYVTITAFNEDSYRTSVADGATSKDGKLYLKFTLSDSSTDFTVDDITVTGGTLSNFTGNRTEYTAEFTPTGSSKVDTTINVAKDKFTNEYFGNTAATEFNWTYDPSSSSGPKSGEVYQTATSTASGQAGKIFLIVDSATSGKFDLIPVKIKSGGSGYELNTSRTQETVIAAPAEALPADLGREPTKLADASNSDASTAATAAYTALTPSVTITAFNNGSSTRAEYAVADGATSNDGKLYLKFTLSGSSYNFTVGDITVTGGTLSNFAGSRTDYTAEFTPSGSSKVDTTINIAKDSFTNGYLGNTAATEFNWKFDPDNGLKDGDVVREVDSSGNATGKLLLLDIESTDAPTKYTLIPVLKSSSGNWGYESANAGSKAGGYALSDLNLIREIGPKPTSTGETISDSVALPILNAAGVMVGIHGDEKGGSKAFSAGTYDASDDLASPDSDGIGWILKGGGKSYGETSTAKGEARGTDMDYYALINSPSSPKLTGGNYKVTVADEVWQGSDTGNIDRVLVKDQGGNSVSITKSGNDYQFTADGNSYYFLEIMGVSGEDAQYSMILDIV